MLDAIVRHAAQVTNPRSVEVTQKQKKKYSIDDLSTAGGDLKNGFYKVM